MRGRPQQAATHESRADRSASRRRMTSYRLEPSHAALKGVVVRGANPYLDGEGARARMVRVAAC